MKENKPILFINSAKTDNTFSKSQNVYDSRVGNKSISKKKEEKKNIEKKNNNENVEQAEFNNNNNKEEIKEDNIIKEEKPQEIEKSFSNKIRLLNRRADLGRFVLVLVKTNTNEYEGLFKGVAERGVILEIGDKDESILIDDITDIIILRV